MKLKLKRLKRALKLWREFGFNNEKERKRKIIEEIEHLDHIDDEELLPEKLRVRIGLIEELKTVLKKNCNVEAKI